MLVCSFIHLKPLKNDNVTLIAISKRIATVTFCCISNCVDIEHKLKSSTQNSNFNDFTLEMEYSSITWQRSFQRRLCSPNRDWVVPEHEHEHSPFQQLKPCNRLELIAFATVFIYMNKKGNNTIWLSIFATIFSLYSFKRCQPISVYCTL